jgi:hypothetical protein
MHITQNAAPGHDTFSKDEFEASAVLAALSGHPPLNQSTGGQLPACGTENNKPVFAYHTAETTTAKTAPEEWKWDTRKLETASAAPNDVQTMNSSIVSSTEHHQEYDKDHAPHRPPWKRQNTWFHIGALIMCSVMWCGLWYSGRIGLTLIQPHFHQVYDMLVRIMNGQYTVTCKMGDLPLDHLRCIFFLRMSNWINWMIAGVSRYLGGLEDPRDMFCFACTALCSLYFTLWRIVRWVGCLCVQLTRSMYQHTYSSMNNPSSPFLYMEQAMQLAETSRPDF